MKYRIQELRRKYYNPDVYVSFRSMLFEIAAPDSAQLIDQSEVLYVQSSLKDQKKRLQDRLNKQSLRQDPEYRWVNNIKYFRNQLLGSNGPRLGSLLRKREKTIWVPFSASHKELLKADCTRALCFAAWCPYDPLLFLSDFIELLHTSCFADQIIL